jgi:hypothetical protein
LGNVGAMKDAFTGLPEDVRSQILRDAGEVARAGAASVARQKAIHALFMDVGLKYVGNAVMQNAMDEIMRDKSMASILLGYAVRLKDYLTRAERDPLAAANIGSIFPNSQNEPGKEDRIFFKTAPDGTAIYMRLPTGKIGEEMQGWLTSPLEMANARRARSHGLSTKRSRMTRALERRSTTIRSRAFAAWCTLRETSPGTFCKTRSR